LIIEGLGPCPTLVGFFNAGASVLQALPPAAQSHRSYREPDGNFLPGSGLRLPGRNSCASPIPLILFDNFSVPDGSGFAMNAMKRFEFSQFRSFFLVQYRK
jgi:hypothetical protein